MYKRSPILRAALSPRASGSTANIAGERLQAEINRIRVLANLNGTVPIEKPVMTPITTSSSPDTDLTFFDELERTQCAVTELITLFNNFRSSVDRRLQSLADSIDSRFKDDQIRGRTEVRDHGFDLPIPRRINGISPALHDSWHSEASPGIEVQRLKDELKLLREDHDRLTAKVKRINELNCESHIRSSIAIKKVRDLIHT